MPSSPDHGASDVSVRCLLAGGPASDDSPVKNANRREGYAPRAGSGLRKDLQARHGERPPEPVGTVRRFIQIDLDSLSIAENPYDPAKKQGAR